MVLISASDLPNWAAKVDIIPDESYIYLAVRPENNIKKGRARCT